MTSLQQSDPESTSSKRAFSGNCRKGIWTLGLVLMFMDISSELVYSLLPIFMTTLGASMVNIGIIEGFAETQQSNKTGLGLPSV